MSHDGARALRVVVVDDSADLRDLIGLVLGLDAGSYEVVGEAENGEQALEVVRSTQPDVVLLDIAMPVMDGIQALPLIREAAPEVAVVMLSGFGSGTAAASATGAGARGYLEKEDLVATLVPQLTSILEGSALRAAQPED